LDRTLLVVLLLQGVGLSRGWSEEVLNLSFRIEALENLISPFLIKMMRSGSPNITLNYLIRPIA
jgi:hypothetical protein